MSLRDRLRADVRAVIDRDPATERALEVLLTSPGLYARWSHRLAHWLWTREHRLLARVLATITRLITGIEIHPGAELGERVVVDHGQGLVIGSTATVGDDVLFYHGVTLGAREEREGQRHPTVGDGVTLGANATVLGDIVVGDGATVGAGAVVLDPVETGETVVGVPAEPVDADGDGVDGDGVDVDETSDDAAAEAASDAADATGETADATGETAGADVEATTADADRRPVDASSAATAAASDGEREHGPEPKTRPNRGAWHRQDSCDELPEIDDSGHLAVETNGGERLDGADGRERPDEVDSREPPDETGGRDDHGRDVDGRDADGRGVDDPDGDQSDQCCDDGSSGTACEAPGS